MSDIDKLCCLTLDEMEIKKAVEYDPSSKTVLGKITLPGHQGEANHGLVFMLGGKLNPVSSITLDQLHFFNIELI